MTTMHVEEEDPTLPKKTTLIVILGSKQKGLRF